MSTKSNESVVDQSLFQREEAFAVSSWVSQIEHIAMTAARRQTRVIGVVSSEGGSGVTRIAELMATSFGQSQRRTLLLSLRKPVDFAASTADEWRPDLPNAAEHVTYDSRGFERLAPTPTPTTRTLFNNVDLIRGSFDADLGDYDQIVVDLPNLRDTGADVVNAIGPAVACDAVLLVCMTGRTSRTDAARAVEQLQTAGAKVAGTLLNDEQNVTLGGDIAAFAKRLRRIAPNFSRRMERFGRESALLN